MSSTIHLPPSVTSAHITEALPVLHIRNQAATASIALQGAHILAYTPEGQENLIWMSKEARYAKDKSLRGGVPICWPWFGAHETNNALPAHGHARTVNWKLIRAEDISSCQTHLVFELIETTHTRAMWPHPGRVRYTVSIGKELELKLETTNLSDKTINIGAALHTYFNIGDIGQISIDGLDGCDFLDKPDGFARKQQRGLVKFNSEVDRIYLDTPGRCEIRDPLMRRRIIIQSKGSHSTVVWNPWKRVAEKMGDLGENGYRQMVCVETANADKDCVALSPGESHGLTAIYRVTDY